MTASLLPLLHLLGMKWHGAWNAHTNYVFLLEVIEINILNTIRLQVVSVLMPAS
jgi:hypothetical protein